MRNRRLPSFFALSVGSLALVFGLFAAATAQQVEDEERSRFVGFVERQISTPDRQFRLGRIEGALSSDVRIESITIADREGVWLRIEDVRLVWNRRALLRRRLEIERLEADSLTVMRRPLPAEGPSEPFEERTFELPDLPVSLDIEAVRVPRVAITEGIIAPQAYALSLEGATKLEDGALDADLTVERLDGAGSLKLQAAFSNETQMLDVDLLLSEPENGVVASLLNLEGRPPVRFAIRGSGPLGDFSAQIALTVEDEQLLAGEAAISRTEDRGFRFLADVGGELERLVPPLYRELVTEGSRVVVDATRAEDGGLAIARAELTSGVAELELSGALAPDGVPTALRIEGILAAPGDSPIDLPGGGGRATIRSGRITANLGGDMGNAWNARIALQGLVTPTIGANDAIIEASGIAAGMADPAGRRLTFELTGSASGLESEAANIAAVLGDAARIEARGAWTSGQPVAVDAARVETGGAALAFAGSIDQAGTDGSYSAEVQDLAVFSKLAGRELAGAADLAATGSLTFSGDAFSLAIDGTTQDLEPGIAALTGLFKGESTLKGLLVRSDAGLRFDDLQIRNPQLSVRAEGGPPGSDADLKVTAVIEDVAAATGRASGRVSLEATVSGTSETSQLAAQITGENLMLDGRPFRGAEAAFEGKLAGSDVDGRLTLSGDLAGMAVRGSADLETLEDSTRAIRNLAVTAGETTVTGELMLQEGLYNGALSLRSPDLSTIAPLMLSKASGALSADIAFSAQDGQQTANLQAKAKDLALAGGVALTSADIALDADDLFGTPVLSGQATATQVRIGEIGVPSVRLQAAPSGGTTAFELASDLAGGELLAKGRLSRADNKSVLALETLQLPGTVVEARFVEPLEIAIQKGLATSVDGLLELGDGRVAVSGRIGEVIALSARLETLPLSVLNAFQPDLEAAGTISGTIESGGTWAAPIVGFDLTGSGLTVALFDLVGIDPIALKAAGRYAEKTLTLDSEAEVAGRTITLAGRIGDELDVSVGVDEIPLETVDALVPQLAPRGTVSAQLSATGTLADPQATFELKGRDITVAQLRAAGSPGIELILAGRFANGAAVLTEAVVEADGGRMTLEGSIGEELDVAAKVTDFPVSLASAVLPLRDLSGTVSGSGRATGLLLDPLATFDLQGNGITTARLQAANFPGLGFTATGRYEAGTATLSGAELAVDDGRITLEGSIGEELDLTARASGFPLSVAGALRPELGLEGSATGTLRATGSLIDPDATFEIKAEEMTAGPLRAAGLTGIEAAASGTFENGMAVIDSATIDAAGGQLRLGGKIGEELDLIANLTKFPAAVANALQPGLELSGTLSGTVTASGPRADPQLDFELRGTKIRAAPLQRAER